MEDHDKATLNQLKYESSQFEAYRQTYQKNIAHAKEAIQVLESALRFYGKDDVARQALEKLDEIRQRAKR